MGATMSSKQKKKSCSACRGYHSPPVGKKCERMVELEDDEDWADFCAEHPPAPSSRWDSGGPQGATGIDKKHLDVDYGSLYMGLSSKEFDMAKAWPLVTGQNDFPPHAGAGKHSEKRDVKPDVTTRPLDPQGGAKPKRLQEIDMKLQVSQLQEEICKLSADNRSSNDKLTRIEALLSRRPERDLSPRPLGKRLSGQEAPRQDRGRPRSRSTRQPSRGKMDYSPSSTSPYGSDSSSSVSPSPRHRKRSPDGDRVAKEKSKRRRYKLSRFLPKDERGKALNTEKLWFCHGQLMLEQYLQGIDITGMLKHNVFIAEKSASRAYLSSGIVKYDEAVRERAKIEGDSSYTGGDMDLAMRFLSSEYARPKSNAGNVNFQNGQRQGQQKKSNIGQVRDPRSGKIFCWLYNGVGCTFENCRYAHICGKCLAPGHSQHSCRNNQTYASALSQAPVSNI